MAEQKEFQMKTTVRTSRLSAGLPVKLHLAVAAIVLALLAIPDIGHAQGIVRGAQEGAYEGSRVAGPVGGVVGGAVGWLAGFGTEVLVASATWVGLGVRVAARGQPSR